MKRQLLIATTNEGKYAEVYHFLETLEFDLVSLSDIKISINPPEESGETLEKNALLKAKYYGEKTGLLTIADDTGLFIDALLGWPGVHSARVADTDEARRHTVLKKMKDIPLNERGAYFQSVMCLYDPTEKTSFMSTGKTGGIIAEKEGSNQINVFGYSTIFFLPEVGKTYGELTLAEKNSVGHRGRALLRMKYHLQNTYSAKNIVVPCALVIKDSQILMQLRNDPHRPDYHNKWEFPGGGVNFGEQLYDNIKRETMEEVGYQVEVVRLLQHIAVESQTYPTFRYQVYLIPYVCKITGGDGVYRDEEVLGVRWFDLDEVLDYPLIGENAKMYQTFLPELKETVKTFKL
ncbi:MAG TPA: RdgB/HAM1 family non-canonical purine NTP pyrophosphatase [Candidatus Kapabacteria bacterium]|nr:RdgB/HAM1 family non-canonical purine NTP pyrophosphatase [Candidatus Kapabacteria bacterium]